MKKNEFIKQIRQKYKMSQKKFAEYLEVSKSLIEKVEMDKIPATPENKYVKAVCALEGLDNEIFKFDEITDEILKKYELTKFSKAFRKFLYFYYGDFWNEEIEKELKEFLTNTLFSYLYEEDNMPSKYLCNYKFELFIEDTINLIKKRALFAFNEEKEYLNVSSCSFYETLLGKALLILTLKNSINFNFYIRDFFHKLEIENIYNIEDEDIVFLRNVFNKLKIYTLMMDFFKSDLADLEDIGLPLTIENIKKLKKQKELEKIQNEIIPAPTDPKDKQICELLQYAPPAFKDKIIEKLLQYKKDIEEL